MRRQRPPCSGCESFSTFLFAVPFPIRHRTVISVIQRFCSLLSLLTLLLRLLRHFGQVMVEMTNRGIAPDSIVLDGIVDGFVQSGNVGEAISFAQHAYNQVNQNHAAQGCAVLFLWLVYPSAGTKMPGNRGLHASNGSRQQEPSVPPRVL